MTEKLSPTQKFTNARLNAIQALYAAEFNQAPMEQVIFDFLNGKIGSQLLREDEASKEEFIELPVMDKELFAKIAQEAWTRKPELDEIIIKSVQSGWENDRIEMLLQAILRAGLAEFFANPNLDAPIIINEYTDITRSFYEGAEVALVNAVLNKFAKVIRGW